MSTSAWPTLEQVEVAYYRLVARSMPNLGAGAGAADITAETLSSQCHKHGIPRKRCRRGEPMPPPPELLMRFMAEVASLLSGVVPPAAPRPPAAAPPFVPEVRSFTFAPTDPNPIPLPNTNFTWRNGSG